MTRATLLLVAALAACQPKTSFDPRLAVGGYPGELVPTSDIGPEFLMRQRVVATYDETDFSFEAVLQFRHGTLTLLALTPFGSKAFVLTQRGTEVSFQRFVDRELPFPPDYILLDIHRAMFMGLGPGSLPDGDHTHQRAGERVSETWARGRVTRRIFSRVDGNPAGEIVIRFPDGYEPGQLPGRVELDNGWFGYQLQIETLSGRVLRGD